MVSGGLDRWSVGGQRLWRTDLSVTAAAPPCTGQTRQRGAGRGEMGEGNAQVAAPRAGARDRGGRGMKGQVASPSGP